MISEVMSSSLPFLELDLLLTLPGRFLRYFLPSFESTSFW